MNTEKIKNLLELFESTPMLRLNNTQFIHDFVIWNDLTEDSENELLMLTYNANGREMVRKFDQAGFSNATSDSINIYINDTDGNKCVLTLYALSLINPVEELGQSTIIV